MRKQQNLFLLAFGLVALGTVTAYADSVWTETAIGDSYIYANAPTSSFGTEINLMLAKNPTNLQFSRKSLLEFDIASHTTPATSYVLDLTIVDSGVGTIADPPLSWTFSVYGYKVGTQSNVETMTWNSFDGNDTNSGSGFSSDKSELLGSFTLVGKGIGAVAFTSAALDTFVNGNLGKSSVIFMIGRDTPESASSNYAHGIATREATAGVATLTAVPSPSSLVALAGLGLMGIVSLGWRQRRTKR